MQRDDIAEIEKRALEELALAKTEELLQIWKRTYLSRKSELNTILRSLKDLSPVEKKELGSLANTTKQLLERAMDSAREHHEVIGAETALDVTLPGKPVLIGHRHPISLLIEEIEAIFFSMGFQSVTGPEVESEWYNFDALNFPPDHPARDMQDAFWIEGKFGQKRYLPRTHTSSVQVRYMETHTPPFRIIIPGRIFRNEATDASHEHTFHQFECLMVGDDISVAHFKYIAEQFFATFFGQRVKVRLRPSYFPFTEPSFEFDLSCLLCGGGGCSVCKGTGWLEIGGAGMVHQHVFEAAGYPKNRYQGFAWGFGLTRLAMMKYKISDIRLLMSGDLRFIRQF